MPATVPPGIAIVRSVALHILAGTDIVWGDWDTWALLARFLSLSLSSSFALHDRPDNQG